VTWAMAGVLLYVALQLAFGFYVSRRVATENDYLVAGRSLGLRLSVFTIFATWFGAETCIGASAQAYDQGLGGVTADPFGYAICLLLMGFLLAVPLWKRKLTTLADLFRDRFGTRSERIVVLLLVPTSVMWAAAQIRAFGQVLGANSDLPATTTITIAALVVICYTALGGMLADAVNDLVQGIVLLCGMVLLLVMMVRSGDLQTALDLASKVGAQAPPRSLLDQLEAWAVPVLGSLVAQELVGRVVSARSPEIARRGSLIAAVLYLAVGIIPVAVGLVAARVHPPIAEPEQVLVQQAAYYLPSAGHVLFLGALVSAILSTVDSALLSAGSLTAHNLVLPLLRGTSERAKIAINRAAVVLFGVVAYALALGSEGVYALVEEASAFGTAGVFVCVMFGLFSSVGGSLSALLSLLLGFVVYLIAQHGLTLSHPYLASLLAALFGYAVGLPFQRRSVAALAGRAADGEATSSDG
jgi:solute:Na+ symporter, SSS family